MTCWMPENWQSLRTMYFISIALVNRKSIHRFVLHRNKSSSVYITFVQFWYKWVVRCCIGFYMEAFSVISAALWADKLDVPMFVLQIKMTPHKESCDKPRNVFNQCRKLLFFRMFQFFEKNISVKSEDYSFRRLFLFVILTSVHLTCHSTYHRVGFYRKTDTASSD